MNEQRMIYRPDGVPVSFEWSGGMYIDVYSLDYSTPDKADPNTGRFERRIAGQNGYPFTCINVWDYGTDSTSIPFNREAFIRTCDEWIEAYGKDYGL